MPSDLCDSPKPICPLNLSHTGPCPGGEDLRHLGESIDGIRELAIIDRYYARDDLSEAGLDV